MAHLVIAPNKAEQDSSRVAWNGAGERPRPWPGCQVLTTLATAVTRKMALDGRRLRCAGLCAGLALAGLRAGGVRRAARR